jgi:chemotaxis protein CheD
MGDPAVGIVRAKRGESVHLLAGQLVYGPGPVAVKTLLGSCVGITLWHARRRIGGMCHYLLPGRARPLGAALDARFGDEAMTLLLQAMDALKTAPEEYEATLSGGADTLAGRGGPGTCIGERNIELGWHLMDRWGFQLGSVEVGDDVPRHVSLDLTSGQVVIRRGQPIGAERAPAPRPTALGAAPAAGRGVSVESSTPAATLPKPRPASKTTAAARTSAWSAL